MTELDRRSRATLGSRDGDMDSREAPGHMQRPGCPLGAATPGLGFEVVWDGCPMIISMQGFDPRVTIITRLIWMGDTGLKRDDRYEFTSQALNGLHDGSRSTIRIRSM